MVTRKHAYGAIASFVFLLGSALYLRSEPTPQPRDVTAASTEAFSDVNLSRRGGADAAVEPQALPSTGTVSGQIRVAGSIGSQARALLATSNNYRALVHSALTSGEPVALRAAFMAAYEECPFVDATSLNADLIKKLTKLPSELAEKWQEFKKSCTASSGIDQQQRRAIVAALQRAQPEWYVLRQNLVANQQTLESIARVDDSHLTMMWLSQASREDPVLAYGAQSPLSDLPPKLALHLMETEYCALNRCYSFNGHVYSCAQTGICGENFVVESHLATLPKEMKNPEHPARVAARARVQVLFPKRL